MELSKSGLMRLHNGKEEMTITKELVFMFSQKYAKI